MDVDCLFSSHYVYFDAIKELYLNKFVIKQYKVFIVYVCSVQGYLSI